MCCIIPSTPIEDETGRIKTKSGRNQFHVSMLYAPCYDCSSFLWFLGQFNPITFGCTQCLLRRKVLDGDMTKYSCFQGYFDCCCFRAGSCGEQHCPTLCSFLEGCFCNCFAVSVNRIYIMEKYDLTSDPCDYRLIRINNCIQLLACVCNIAAIFVEDLRRLASILNRISDVVYHCVSGCMTAQTAHEVNYRRTQISTSPTGYSEIQEAEKSSEYGSYQQLEHATVIPTAPAEPIY